MGASYTRGAHFAELFIFDLGCNDSAESILLQFLEIYLGFMLLNYLLIHD